jgi:hypothetical protein
MDGPVSTDALALERLNHAACIRKCNKMARPERFELPTPRFVV